MRLKNDFASNDPNVVFSYISFLDDDMERLVETCSLERFLLQNVDMNDKNGHHCRDATRSKMVRTQC